MAVYSLYSNHPYAKGETKESILLFYVLCIECMTIQTLDNICYRAYHSIIWCRDDFIVYNKTSQKISNMEYKRYS